MNYTIAGTDDNRTLNLKSKNYFSHIKRVI